MWELSASVWGSLLHHLSTQAGPQTALPDRTELPRHVRAVAHPVNSKAINDVSAGTSI